MGSNLCLDGLPRALKDRLYQDDLLLDKAVIQARNKGEEGEGRVLPRVVRAPERSHPFFFASFSSPVISC
jgi:hypothetical protein